MALLRTADLIRRYYTEVIEAHGITAQQYNVLRILRGAGPAGLATLTVARRMIEASPGITRMLDRLEAKGWVRRERDRADRRQVLCYLTRSGQELLKRLDRPVELADDDILAMLSRAEQGGLIQLLDKVRAGLRSPR